MIVSGAVVSNYPMSGAEEGQASKAFSEMYSKNDFKPIPSEIHMIWVGSKPGATQQDYLLQWAQKNPASTVNLWVDSLQFDTYATNKSVREKVSALFLDAKQYKIEKLLRNLCSQLKTTLNQPVMPMNQSAQQQALSELNKELSSKGNESWKQVLLPNSDNVTAGNASDVLAAFQRLIRGNDEKFLLVDRMILDQTVKSWDRCIDHLPRDVATLEQLQNLFADTKNICIRDLSNSSDIQLQNRDAYQHEIVGRNGAYPAASDIARYEILYNYGGVYADIDLECLQPLSGALVAHPDLMLVGLPAAKVGASKSGASYVNNNLLASHPNSKMLSEFITHIRDDYESMRGDQFSGDRYFSRPNKSVIETTGPNALRGHLNTTIHLAQGQQELIRTDALSLATRIWEKDEPQNDTFWKAMGSHIKFPDSYVNFDAEEQLFSATSDMA